MKKTSFYAGAATALAAQNVIGANDRVKLQFDPAKMKFIGDAEADKMLTRPYRKPYVVPEKV